VTRKNLVVGARVDDTDGLVGIDATNGGIIWHSPSVGFPRSDSVRYVDLNADGEREIVFGTQWAMHVTK
jgi:hypothetical protein